MIVILVAQGPRVQAWAWDTHRFMENEAENVFSDNSFFSNYHSTLYEWCIKPDQGWGESYWHWYHVDVPHGPENTSEGTLPWAVENIFENIVSKLSSGDWDNAVQLMGAICHFTEDASQPLHSTSDYSPGGNHGSYESEVNYHLGEMSIPVYVPHELDNIFQATITVLEGSFNFTDEDPEGGVNLSDYLENDILWNDTIKSITENRLRAGVQFTANLWYTAMIRAGLTIQAPTLISPSDGSTLTDNTPSFTWTPADGTSFYDFQLASDNVFTSDVLTVKDLSTNSYTLTNPLSSGEWYWRVRAGDNSTHAGQWSQTQQFTVEVGLVPHDPIFIDGNDNFIPANGVTSGSGTENDSYIIENWEINAENADGIRIRNADVYFIIRNVYVYGGFDNDFHGVFLDNVMNGLVTDVISENNCHAIHLRDSENNVVEGCTAKDSSRGIQLRGSSNNIIRANDIENNYWGIRSEFGSSNNFIYHNNLTSITGQAYDTGSNYWDNGYPSGGNYWSDYTGVDENRGENQDILGSDGIGDTPYGIPGDNNRDRYPLMNPWPLGVSISISPTYQSGVPGENLDYIVTVSNFGGVADNYDLTVSDDAGWSLTLSDNLLENVSAGENRTTTLTVTIPDNAEACIQNSVTVTATSRSDNTVSDNESCLAHVAVVRGVKVTISPVENSGPPGVTLSYTVTVGNTGNIADNFSLENSDNAGWVLSLDNGLLTIQAGENRTTTLRVTIPENAENCTKDNVMVTATSQENAQISGNASCIAHAVITVEEFTLQLVADWNLVSFPVASDNDTPNNLFAGVSYTMYYWAGVGYAPAPGNDPVQLGIGYWVKPSENVTVTTSGVRPENYSIDLAADWNLVGFPRTSENTTPNNLFENVTSYTMYYWTGVGYASAPGNDPVQLGIGYWVKPSENITVTV